MPSINCYPTHWPDSHYDNRAREVGRLRPPRGRTAPDLPAKNVAAFLITRRRQGQESSQTIPLKEAKQLLARDCYERRFGANPDENLPFEHLNETLPHLKPKCPRKHQRWCGRTHPSRCRPERLSHGSEVVALRPLLRCVPEPGIVIATLLHKRDLGTSLARSLGCRS